MWRRGGWGGSRGEDFTVILELNVGRRTLVELAMPKKLDIVLRSDYSPETCLAKLAEQIDLDQPSLSSPGGYKGNRPIVGCVGGYEFRLHKRQPLFGRKNSYVAVLFGRITADGHGALIEAYWEAWRKVRAYSRILLVVAIVAGTPIFLLFLPCTLSRTCTDQGGHWIGVILPPAIILGALFLRRPWLSVEERTLVTGFLERTLAAAHRPVPSEKRDWESSLDDFRLWV